MRSAAQAAAVERGGRRRRAAADDARQAVGQPGARAGRRSTSRRRRSARWTRSSHDEAWFAAIDRAVIHGGRLSGLRCVLVLAGCFSPAGGPAAERAGSRSARTVGRARRGRPRGRPAARARRRRALRPEVGWVWVGGGVRGTSRGASTGTRGTATVPAAARGGALPGDVSRRCSRPRARLQRWARSRRRAASAARPRSSAGRQQYVPPRHLRRGTLRIAWPMLPTTSLISRDDSPDRCASTITSSRISLVMYSSVGRAAVFGLGVSQSLACPFGGFCRLGHMSG